MMHGGGAGDVLLVVVGLVRGDHARRVLHIEQWLRDIVVWAAVTPTSKTLTVLVYTEIN